MTVQEVHEVDWKLNLCHKKLSLYLGFRREEEREVPEGVRAEGSAFGLVEVRDVAETGARGGNRSVES